MELPLLVAVVGKAVDGMVADVAKDKDFDIVVVVGILVEEAMEPEQAMEEQEEAVMVELVVGVGIALEETLEAMVPVAWEEKRNRFIGQLKTKVIFST